MAVAFFPRGLTARGTRARARALDTARGNVSRDEAKTWLRGAIASPAAPAADARRGVRGRARREPRGARAFEVKSCVRVLFSAHTNVESRGASWSGCARRRRRCRRSASGRRRDGKWKKRRAGLAARRRRASSPNSGFFGCGAAFWKNMAIAAAAPGVPTRTRSLELALVPPRSRPRRRSTETSLIAAAAARRPGGVFAGIAYSARRARRRRRRGGGAAAPRSPARRSSRGRTSTRHAERRDEGHSGVRPRRSHKRNHV